MSNFTSFSSIKIKTSVLFKNSGGITTLVAANPSASWTINLPDPGANDDVLYKTLAQTVSNKTLGTNLAAGGFKVTGAADPTASGDYATKNYVDNAQLGLDIHAAVKAATTAALPANTYVGTPTFTLTATSNGALTVDSYAVVLGDRLLVKNEATGSHNGIYTVTATGGAGAPYVLTRATDYDSTAEVSTTAFVFVANGSTNAGQGFASGQGSSAILDTTAITFSQFSGGQVYSQGNGINITSNVITAVGDGTTISVSGAGIAIKSTYVGQTSITTLGTITTGVWNGTSIAIANGGTGQTTASAGFNALSPVTSTGDLIIGNGASSSTRLAIGTSGTLPISNGSTLVYGNIASTNFGANTLAIANGGFGGSTAAANTAFGNFTGSTAAPGFGTVSIAAGGSGQTSASAALAAFGGDPLQKTILTKTTNYTQTATDYIVQFTTSTSNLVYTLQAVSSSNKGIFYTVSKVDSGSGTVVITPASGTINGASTWTIDTQWDSADIWNDGTNWYIS